MNDERRTTTSSWGRRGLLSSSAPQLLSSPARQLLGCCHQHQHTMDSRSHGHQEPRTDPEKSHQKRSASELKMQPEGGVLAEKEAFTQRVSLTKGMLFI